MTITLENIIPLPMVELDTSSSSVWEADSFIFGKGESYLVEAESGKGKTSLLSMIYGLRKDYKGVLRIDAADVKKFGQKHWAHLRKMRFSYIFQGLELFNDLTALENISLKNRITNHKSLDDIHQMAEMLGVDSFLSKKCGILSFGQQQRVAIIRALCQPFDFLLADECFSHIDHKNSQTAYNLIIEECKNQNAGLILTSLGNNDFKFDHRVAL